MGTRKTVVVIRHDDGYGDPEQFLHYLSIKLRGSDMVVESAHDGDLMEAAKRTQEPEKVSMELNEHTRLILGQPCFQCGRIAALLRKDGHEILKKAQEEQAYVLHWLLGLYENHGETWEQHFKSEMSRINASTVPVDTETSATD